MVADETLVEERDEEMVAFLGSRVPIKRKGWFLKPTSNSSESSLFYPLSSPSSPPCNFTKTPKCSFKGWVCSLRFWDQWVEKLRPRYGDLWKKVGVLDAISASRYKFKRDTSSLWGVARFWCEETNTFIFPWAEATVTLEDVMVLGGFSVLGKPVRSDQPLEGELGELATEMVREVRRFNQTKSKKADITTWMKYYLEEGNGGELEHIAFLALWLTRFVLLAPPARTIGFHVIPVAVQLARGVRIALAPAVLASIYRDLQVMKDYLVVYGRPETPALTLWAPLHILQLWIWERFLALRPESASFVGSDVPRAARWHNVGKTLKYGFVRSVIKSQDEIQWRPYLASSWDRGRRPSYYRDDDKWICTSEVSDDGLESFSRCLRTCELVGLDSIQQYLPHRVARQFGLDQDIPSFVPRATWTLEVAWGTFDVCAKNVKFYIPSRLFESDVTLRYSIWWDRVRRLLRKKMRGKKRKKTQSLECCYKKELQDGDNVPISKWVSPKNQRVSKKQRCEDPSNSATFPATQHHHACIKNREICGESKLFLEFPETMKHEGNALSSIKVENGAVACNPVGIEYDRVNGAITSYPMEIKQEANAGESMNDPIVSEEIKENVKSEEVEEIDTDNRSDTEVIIEKLKVEIALIHARVKNLDSLSKALTSVKHSNAEPVGVPQRNAS